MKKIEMVKKWLEDKNNIEWLQGEVDLLLENNYGADVQFLYNLVDDTKEDLGDYYKKLDKSQALKLKWGIIKACEDALSCGIGFDVNNIDISIYTIKKACKEVNFYSTFTTEFINNLNGEAENIEELKKVFKKYYLG